jgi:hypothetical protein
MRLLTLIVSLIVCVSGAHPARVAQTAENVRTNVQIGIATIVVHLSAAIEGAESVSPALNLAREKLQLSFEETENVWSNPGLAGGASSIQSVLEILSSLYAVVQQIGSEFTEVKLITKMLRTWCQYAYDSIAVHQGKTSVTAFEATFRAVDRLVVNSVLSVAKSRTDHSLSADTQRKLNKLFDSLRDLNTHLTGLPRESVVEQIDFVSQSHNFALAIVRDFEDLTKSDENALDPIRVLVGIWISTANVVSTLARDLIQRVELVVVNKKESDSESVSEKLEVVVNETESEIESVPAPDSGDAIVSTTTSVARVTAEFTEPQPEPVSAGLVVVDYIKESAQIFQDGAKHLVGHREFALTIQNNEILKPMLAKLAGNDFQISNTEMVTASDPHAKYTVTMATMTEEYLATMSIDNLIEFAKLFETTCRSLRLPIAGMAGVLKKQLPTHPWAKQTEELAVGWKRLAVRAALVARKMEEIKSKFPNELVRSDDNEVRSVNVGVFPGNEEVEPAELPGRVERVDIDDIIVDEKFEIKRDERGKKKRKKKNHRKKKGKTTQVEAEVQESDVGGAEPLLEVEKAVIEEANNAGPMNEPIQLSDENPTNIATSDLANPEPIIIEITADEDGGIVFEEPIDEPVIRVGPIAEEADLVFEITENERKSEGLAVLEESDEAVVSTIHEENHVEPMSDPIIIEKTPDEVPEDAEPESQETIENVANTIAEELNTDEHNQVVPIARMPGGRRNNWTRIGNLNRGQQWFVQMPQAIVATADRLQYLTDVMAIVTEEMTGLINDAHCQALDIFTATNVGYVHQHLNNARIAVSHLRQSAWNFNGYAHQLPPVVAPVYPGQM